jgi:diguanylate cyclase (GGDEF)-like protein
MTEITPDAMFDCRAILKTDLFSSLLKEEHEFIISRSSLFQLRMKGLLFSPGQKAEHFYMLLKGSIRVFKQKPGSDNADEEVARFTEGDTIGDFDFARSANYDAYAEAVEDATLIMFPCYGLTMDDIALEAPHTVSKILLSSIEMMTGRIKRTHKIIVENMSWVQELYRKAYEDPGTGLWKQTFLTDEINRILENPMALIMLKPDRFKQLVDSRGHVVGDDAMIHIGMILRNITRSQGRGWPLRFKSNETGILINKCNSIQAKAIAGELHAAIAALPPVPARDSASAFSFTGTVVWAVWPQDESIWDLMFKGTYNLLLETWKQGGNRVAHFSKKAEA